MKTPFTLALALLSTMAMAQGARLVLHDGVTMRFPDSPTTPTYLVIGNNQPEAIVTSGVANGGGGNIVLEHENNRIRWVSTTSAALNMPYTVPLTTGAGSKIPLTITKVTQGVGGATASFVISTHNWASNGTPAANAWDNRLYRPTGVNHMNSSIVPIADNSHNAIDRFWLVDAGASYASAAAFATKPEVTLSFGFSPSETTNPGNTPGLAPLLMAQRYNSTIGHWGDWGPFGTTTANSVQNISVEPAHFFANWTLANGTHPLPVTLLNWDGNCTGGNAVELRWSTATEKNNAYFTVEKSLDATTWEVLGLFPGSENSTSTINYRHVDQTPAAMAYYRLSQTDLDGTTTQHGIIAAGCHGGTGVEIVNAWDDLHDLNVVVSSSLAGVYDLTMLDAQGRTMGARPRQVVNNGLTTLKWSKGDIATGIYTVRLQDGNTTLSRRLLVH